VNQTALDAAGITKKTKDPPGGRIMRGDANDEPTGVLVDNAADLVASKVPPPTDVEIERAIVTAMERLVKVGITNVHDAGVDRRTLAIYRKLASEDRLPIRIDAMLDGQQSIDGLRNDMKEWKNAPAIGMLTVRAVKLYADGAMGSRGALMFEPYADEPTTSGLPVTAPDELKRRIAEIVREGFQPAVHAIGDRGCAETLQDFIDAKAPRPRIEHLQVLRPSDMRLLVESHAVASMQPTHATSDAPWAEARLGHGTERQKGAYAWRSVLQAGVPLACGSDFPVESIDPRVGIFAAETREWMPEQRLTREEALRCFTSGAAYAEGAESHRGKIAVGYDADVTVFGEDAMTVPDVRALAVKAVIVGGRVLTF
jgi:predicted amidohydrolase YtcJ